MQDGYRVHPEALDRYAAQLEQASERVQQIMSSLGSIEIPSNAFGLLPDAHGLYSSYQEHHDADLQNCSDLSQLLMDTAEGLSGTAEGYRTIDFDVVHTMEVIPA